MAKTSRTFKAVVSTVVIGVALGMVARCQTSSAAPYRPAEHHTAPAYHHQPKKAH